MSDTHQYYYIKLKDNYFDKDNIKLLEAQPNGYIYSLILLKLYVRAAPNNGRLMMTQSIPYDPSNIEALARVIGHDIDHVKQAIRAAIELEIITVVQGRELWMTEIQNMIGKSSNEGDRKRLYRQHLKQLEAGNVEAHFYGDNGETDIRPPERELKPDLKQEEELKPSSLDKNGTKERIDRILAQDEKLKDSDKDFLETISDLISSGVEISPRRQRWLKDVFHKSEPRLHDADEAERIRNQPRPRYTFFFDDNGNYLSEEHERQHKAQQEREKASASTPAQTGVT